LRLRIEKITSTSKLTFANLQEILPPCHVHRDRKVHFVSPVEKRNFLSQTAPVSVQATCVMASHVQVASAVFSIPSEPGFLLRHGATPRLPSGTFPPKQHAENCSVSSPHPVAIHPAHRDTSPWCCLRQLRRGTFAKTPNGASGGNPSASIHPRRRRQVPHTALIPSPYPGRRQKLKQN